MKKESKGITLLALIITIVVALMVFSIGIAILNENEAYKVANQVSKNKKYQEYRTAIEMAISEEQLKDATRQVDQDYLNELLINIQNKSQFEECKKDIDIIGFNIVTSEIYKNGNNAIYIKTKEGYQFVVDIDLEIHDIDKINTTELTDPESTDPESTDPESTDPESTDPEPTDPESTDPESTDPESTTPNSSQHTSGHVYRFYNKRENNAGSEGTSIHPQTPRTTYYKCCKICGKYFNSHRLSSEKYYSATTPAHYITCTYYITRYGDGSGCGRR